MQGGGCEEKKMGGGVVKKKLGEGVVKKIWGRFFFLGGGEGGGS